jgi:hypothetical protein
MGGSNQKITSTGRGWVEESSGPKSVSAVPIGSPIKEEFVKNPEAEMD